MRPSTQLRLCDPALNPRTRPAVRSGSLCGPAGSTRFFLSATGSGSCQSAGPEPHNLLGAFSRESRCLTSSFGGRSAARGSDDSVRSAKPHAHQRVLFGPWVFHLCFHGSWRARHEIRRAPFPKKKGWPKEPPLLFVMSDETSLIQAPRLSGFSR